MNNNELREGLMLAIRRELEWTINVGVGHTSKLAADAALAYIRQHDGHAEFVRAVQLLLHTATHSLNTDEITEADNSIWDAIRLCAAELLGQSTARTAKGDEVMFGEIESLRAQLAAAESRCDQMRDALNRHCFCQWRYRISAAIDLRL